MSTVNNSINNNLLYSSGLPLSTGVTGTLPLANYPNAQSMKVDLTTSNVTTSLTQLTFSTTVWDTATGISSNQYTIPTTGYWMYISSVQFSSVAITAGNPVAISLYVSGSPVETAYTYPPTYTGQTSAKAVGVLHLTATNVVTLYAQSSTNTANTTGYLILQYLGS